jgi:CRP-like cAMP-binding protein
MFEAERVCPFASAPCAQFKPSEALLNPASRDDCYLMMSGIVSVQLGSEGTEVDLLGPGDLVNLSAILESGENEHFVVAITACETLHISAAILAIAAADPQIRFHLHRYVQERLVRSMRKVACIAHHRVERRLAFWIALATQIGNLSELAITHDQLSRILAACRPTVTNAMHDLESKHAIWSRRNEIAVRDRAALMQAACDCLSEEHDASQLGFRGRIGLGHLCDLSQSPRNLAPLSAL